MTYNSYIFDPKNKEILRDFEGAYKNNDNVYPDQFDIDTPKFKLALNAIKNVGLECHVLDIGAGYGAFVNHVLNQNIRNAVGVEISLSAIQKGKKLFGPNLPLFQGDLTKSLPYSDNSFDVIVFYGVIGWLLDYADVCLKEIQRLLKKDGVLFISMGFHENNIFFRDIINTAEDFPILLSKYFKVKNFFIDYHEIGSQDLSSQDSKISEKPRDLVAICGMCQE